MKITEAAIACGLTPDTIRFYEKSGMLPNISRGADGHRRFRKYDIEWMTLLYWLRETGMSQKEMLRFTQLAKSNENTFSQRREILLTHGEELKRRRRQLDKCEEVLAYKLASYEAMDREKND